MRHDNPRKDILSRSSFPKEKLFRFVLIEGIVTLDENYSLKGRGFYLLKDLETLRLAKRKKLLEKKGKLSDPSFYEMLEGKL